jgi:transcriptional regulator with XRE-family HTH domain
MNDISNLLTNARQQAGLTLHEVAKKTGIGFTTINAWERGASVPRAKNRRVIAKFYGIPEGQLASAKEAEDQIDIARREFLSQYEPRVIVLHKTAWAEAETLVKKLASRDLNSLFDQLIREASTQV